MIPQAVHRRTFPAQPGWNVVGLDEEQGLFRLPVVAWLREVRLNPLKEAFATMLAIMCTGSVDDLSTYALQLGDGLFFTYHEALNDEGSLLAHFRREEAKRLPRDGAT
jgi:hypothetical protein